MSDERCTCIHPTASHHPASGCMTTDARGRCPCLFRGPETGTTSPQFLALYDVALAELSTLRDRLAAAEATIRVHEHTIRSVSTQRDEAVAKLAAERQAHEETRADLRQALEWQRIAESDRDNAAGALVAERQARERAEAERDEIEREQILVERNLDAALTRAERAEAELIRARELLRECRLTVCDCNARWNHGRATHEEDCIAYLVDVLIAAPAYPGTEPPDCELVDCKTPGTHTHQARCDHARPGDGSCDNCRTASAAEPPTTTEGKE